MERAPVRNAKISVIVPVYNVAPYLDRCLGSICGQTETDLEILCIYTESIDGTWEKLRAWAERDARIRLLRRDDGGLGGARNMGLAHAKGRYIAFADSDDWLDADMLEGLYRALTVHAAQIAECGFRNVYAGRVEVEATGSRAQTEASRLEALESLIDWGRFKPVVWNKLYTREVIGDIRFPENCLSEDEFTTYKIVSRANRLVYVDEAKYNYDRTREDSLTAQPFREAQLDVCFAMREQLEFFEEHHIDALREKILSHYAWVLLDRLERAHRARLRGPKLRRVLDMVRQDAPRFAAAELIPPDAKKMLARLARFRMAAFGLSRLHALPSRLLR